jgi:predicted RNA-binding Zn-ribbon protein involved in translation (DUF1610 family)
VRREKDVAGIDPYVALAVGAVAASALAFSAFYLLRRLRMRRAAVGAPPGPEVASDRAYNRLAMARREASLLEAQGVDTTRARDLIQLADRSLQSRDFDRAYELAHSAHESLVLLKREQGGPLFRPNPAPVAATATTLPSRLSAPVVPAPATPESGASPSAAVQIPKNKLESQFQLHLFEKEVSSRTAGPSVDSARAQYDLAQAAFGREEYTEALRLALKARRQLGGAVETLGPSTPATPSVNPKTARPLPTDAARTAEATAHAARCPRCGQPIIAGDAFCRGCGAPYAPLSCPNCGAARTTADAFCGKCGTRYD